MLLAQENVQLHLHFKQPATDLKKIGVGIAQVQNFFFKKKKKNLRCLFLLKKKSFFDYNFIYWYFKVLMI